MCCEILQHFPHNLTNCCYFLYVLLCQSRVNLQNAYCTRPRDRGSIQSISRVIFRLLAPGLIWFLGNGAYSAPDFDGMLSSILQRWGGSASQRFNAWRGMVQSSTPGADLEKLTKVNLFFNRQIRFGDDLAIWGQPDYWATPLETLGQGTGDCEDFVIAKYFSLRMMGMEVEKLRLVYVRAHTGINDSAPVAHMVLAYYERPDSEPLVLDSLMGDIRLASRRPDLTPIFSFNNDGVFATVPGKGAEITGSIGRLSRWEDLLKRARAEGFQ